MQKTILALTTAILIMTNCAEQSSQTDTESSDESATLGGVAKRSTLEEATDLVVNKKLTDAGGEGGLIAIDKHGKVSMTFNTEGMYRGYAKPGERVVGIYDNEQ